MGEITDKVKGSAKETIGEITGNDKLRREGKIDQFSGDVKGKAEEAKHAVKQAAGKFVDRRHSDNSPPRR